MQMEPLDMWDFTLGLHTVFNLNIHLSFLQDQDFPWSSKEQGY